MAEIKSPREIAATIVEEIVAGNPMPDIDYPAHLHALVNMHVKLSMDRLDFYAKKIINKKTRSDRRRELNSVPEKLRNKVEKYTTLIWRTLKNKPNKE